ncbi:hypothetical protein [Nitrolancea hollandica]|uniref:Uncharacterized protein n=1 Tax=Nitrolancea hollandica Lb TaxID=1129897 RepID=I4EHV0_9BACT|nr:hypothetical protein [Nitrolancea hollandica]CCF84262.1 conserved hypothetical protein [Nitrolancea hollandica Lb]
MDVYDVRIAGDGYMVKAGTYRREQDGVAETRLARVRMNDFYGGQQRAAQLERDKIWRGCAAWPAYDSQGISAGPGRVAFAETVAAPNEYDPKERSWSVAADGVVYVIQQKRLYKVTKNAGTGAYTGLSYIGSFANPAVDVALVGQRIVVAHGALGNCGTYRTDTGVFSTTEVGKMADLVCNFVGVLALHEPASVTAAYRLQLANNATAWPPTWTVMNLDSGIKKLFPHDGDMWAMTELTAGRVTGYTSFAAEASMPRTAAPDDLTWVLTHNGRLYLWLGNEVHTFNKSKGEFEPAGLRGRATYGACSVGRWFVCCIEGEQTGKTELWGHDGRGWWLIDCEEESGSLIRWPVGVNGAADNVDVLTGRGAVVNQTYAYQFFRRVDYAGLADHWTITSSLLDANDRDLEKAWRRVGAEFAWPDGRGTSDLVTVTVDYSTDGGATWATAASGNVAGNAGQSATVAGDLSPAALGKFIQVRVTVSSIVDWSPVLLCLWAEAEVLDDPTRRRRWRFTVQCKDAVIRRDGGVDVTGARVLADRLWGAWSAGGVVTFRDIDYDLTSTEYTARLVDIVEKISKPRDAGTFADGEIELSLVEV